MKYRAQWVGGSYKEVFDVCICKENLRFSKYWKEKQMMLTVAEAVIYIYKAPAKYKETFSNFRNFWKWLARKL